MANERKPRESKAEHHFIGRDSAVVDDISRATGIRYVSKENGGAVDFQIPEGEPRLWLALFGARTLATNEASAARQGGDDAAGQLEAIRTRLTGIAEGVWAAERSGGPRINLDALAQALADAYIRARKLDKERREEGVQRIRAKLATQERGEHQKALSVPGVRDAYQRHLGKEVASLDQLDLLA